MIDSSDRNVLVVADARGREVEVPSPPARVVSLVPSMTETLFDLGVGGAVAGITEYCLFPAAELAPLPRVGGTKNPDLEKIRALHPDLVYMNLEENLRPHGEAIEAFATVWVSEPKTVADVLLLIRTLGRIHRVDDRAEELATAIETRAGASSTGFTFACPIWKKPWMWCGGDTYVSSLIEAVGGRNVLQDQSRYPRVELDAVLALAPDIVFLPDEPWAFDPDDQKLLLERGFSNVSEPLPGHLFTWHGSRTLLGLGFLRGWLQQFPDPGGR